MIHIANCIYVCNDVVLDATYVATVGEDLVQLLNFLAETVGATINTWAENHTLVLVVINVLYFKAPWGITFSNYFNNEDIFYTTAIHEMAVNSKTHFMHMIQYLMYSHKAVLLRITVICSLLPGT